MTAHFTFMTARFPIDHRTKYFSLHTKIRCDQHSLARANSHKLSFHHNHAIQTYTGPNSDESQRQFSLVWNATGGNIRSTLIQLYSRFTGSWELINLSRQLSLPTFINYELEQILTSVYTSLLTRCGQ